MKIPYHLVQLAVLGSISILMLPVGTRAETQVEARVSSRVSSSGQTVGQEPVRTGDQSVEVKVRTVVNGQSVEPINLEVPTADGSTTVMVEQSTTAATGTAPESQTEVTVNGQPVQSESPLPPTAPLLASGHISQSPSSSPSPTLLDAVTDWIKGLWRSIIELLS